VNDARTLDYALNNLENLNPMGARGGDFPNPHTSGLLFLTPARPGIMNADSDIGSVIIDLNKYLILNRLMQIVAGRNEYMTLNMYDFF